MHSLLIECHPDFRRIEAPGLPVYTAGMVIVGVVGAVLGRWSCLATPFLFLALSLLLHAVFAGRRTVPFWRSAITDLRLAVVECPFGLGKLAGSVFAGNYHAAWNRLAEGDAEMNRLFPEIVSDLWSNNLALLLALVLVL